MGGEIGDVIKIGLGHHLRKQPRQHGHAAERRHPPHPRQAQRLGVRVRALVHVLVQLLGRRRLRRRLFLVRCPCRPGGGPPWGDFLEFLHLFVLVRCDPAVCQGLGLELLVGHRQRGEDVRETVGRRGRGLHLMHRRRRTQRHA